MNIWDTAGQERYHALNAVYYREAAGALIVYDQTDVDSFSKVKQWALELSDVLGKFFALLPEPVGGISRQRIVNRKGGSAELFVLKYNSVDKSAPCYWYGTTAGAVHGIIQGGFTGAQRR